MKKVFTFLTMMVMLSFTSQAAYYLVGNPPFGNGWNPADGVLLTDEDGNGEFTFQGTINGAIWFVMADGLAEANDWTTFNNTMRIGPTGGDETITAGEWVTTQKSGGDHGAYKFTGSGEVYTITFIPAISKFMISGKVDEVPITSYTVAGAPASVFGSEWDPANTDNDMMREANGIFKLQKHNCELTEGTELAFKVAANHSWDEAWPNDNFVVTIPESAAYDITITFDSVTAMVDCALLKKGSIDPPVDPRTGDLFILGEVNGNAWDPSVGVKMETEDQNIFTASITTNGESMDENGVGYSYFSFTTKLSDNSGDWDGIHDYRFGSGNDGLTITPDLMGQELPIYSYNTDSFRVLAGNYEITINLDEKKMVITGGEVSPYKFEKVWSVDDVTFMPTNDVRQGFGMKSKFYVNNKADQTVLVIGKNGLTNTTYPGGANCGITRDEAGNLVISNAAFPGTWEEATIKVINPETNEMKEYAVPAECGIEGRCDFLGFAQGNLMEDGVLYLTGATNSGISIMTIAGGEVCTDDCYVAPCDGLTPSTSTVINYFKDLNDEDALLYVTRNAAPAKIMLNEMEATAFTLPNKGACNGAFAFVWDEKEFVVYPTLPNYQNGFAIAEANAEEPIVEVESTVAANGNGFTSNWLNAEVDALGVTIYQYYPGGHLSVYRLTKNVAEVTVAPTITYEVTDEGVVITATGEGEVHLYVNGEEVENPYTYPFGDEEVTIVVTATAQGEGKQVSEPATLEITIPAKPAGENGYVIEKVWEVTDLSFMPTNDVRQGFGMNSKFYVNNKADQTVLVIGKNGLTNTTYPGGANCGIARDEAGNLVISNAAFPGAWEEATIKVINPETNEMKEYAVPTECGIEGRCDFLGFAQGNLMENGMLFLTGATTNGVSMFSIVDGEVSTDDCFAAPCDGVTPTTSTVINYYKDLAGEDALLYVTRNAAPAKLAVDGDSFVATALTLPGKGACNGAFPFVWDGKELFVYPQEPNYQDGFAVAEAGAEEPIVAVPSSVTANANGFQCNWLNAEVDEAGVTIYQYYPGSHMSVYRLTKKGGNVEELINDTNKVVAGVRYYNIMGQEMKEANGLTIVVTTYTDGSHSAVKVIK